MVVFQNIVAYFSDCFCSSLPGDIDEKLAFLEEGLVGHYPDVTLSKSFGESNVCLTVSGKLNDIADIQEVLDKWTFDDEADLEETKTNCKKEDDIHAEGEEPGKESNPDSTWKATTLKKQTIKDFVENWKLERNMNVEEQEDTSEIEILAETAGRRRKPGTPRKVKAHVPEAKPSLLADSSSKMAPRSSGRRRGRPRKYFDFEGFDDEDLENCLSELSNQENARKLNPTEDSLDDILDDDSLKAEDQEKEEIVSMEEIKAKIMEEENTLEEEACEMKKELYVEKRGRKPRHDTCIAREEIEDHLRSLKDNENESVTCHLCTHKCNKKASLKLHYLRCHLERKFQCKLCGKKYTMLKELTSHRLTHIRKHGCDLCGKKFATKFLLNGHKERKHLKKKKVPTATLR